MDAKIIELKKREIELLTDYGATTLQHKPYLLQPRSQATVPVLNGALVTFLLHADPDIKISDLSGNLYHLEDTHTAEQSHEFYGQLTLTNNHPTATRTCELLVLLRQGHRQTQKD